MASSEGSSGGAAYAVFTTSRADKDLDKLQPSDKERVLDGILALGDDPHPNASTNLQGRDGYRLRVGDYRALYVVDESAREVTVHRVAHRREAYR